MLRIIKNVWISTKYVASICVKKEGLCIYMEDESAYILEPNSTYISNVCSYFNIPYNEVQGLLAHDNTKTDT